MANELQTFREVSQAIGAINWRLNWMIGVYAASVLAGLAVLGYMNSRINAVSDTTSEIKGQLTGFGQQLTSIKQGVDALQSQKQQGRLEAPLENPF